MEYAWPYIVSLILGYLIIDVILGGKHKLDLYTHLFLAGGLGLGISGQCVFLSYPLFGQLNQKFAVIFHAGLLAAPLLLKIFYARKNKLPLFNREGITPQSTAFLLAIGVLSIPLWMEATVYQYGGWDAWSVWNLKAKFLFMGGEYWKNMLGNELWRSSPHYPLLLPLINVWGWIFVKEPAYFVPLLTGFIFTVLTAGLLFTGIRNLTRKSFGILAVFLLLTLTFYLKLAASQYADILVSYFILSALFCLVKAKIKEAPPYALLAGISLGILSFVKGEGNIASLIIGLCACPYLFFGAKERLLPRHQNTMSVKAWMNDILGGISLLTRFQRSSRLLMYFGAGLITAYIPTVIFQALYAPENLTFINGLTSSAHPSTLSRLAVVSIALPLDLVSGKWNGVWLLLAMGLVIGRKKCFDPAIRIIPIFMAAYLCVVLAFYYVNTRWEIVWFISASLNRIVFSLLPVTLFWVFYSLEENETAAS